MRPSRSHEKRWPQVANELEHIGQTIETAAATLVSDAVDYVKAHPQYGQLVEALGLKAITALANEVGVTL